MRAHPKIFKNVGLTETVKQAAGAVPSTRKINNHALDKDLSLTSTDVGALPTTGGTLRGALHFLFPDARPNANCMIANDDASGILSCAYGYYQDRFDIHFYDEKGAWASNPLVVGRNGNVTVPGNLSCGAVFDGGQRVYSPNNPQPSAGYTKAESDARYVQGFRLGAKGHSDNGNQGAVPAGGPDGTTITTVWQRGDWVAVDYRPPQFLINGQWLNVGVV